MSESRKDRIKELETELRLISNVFYVKGEKGDGYHARHNKYLLRTFEIRKELEKISLKWRLKKWYVNFRTKLKNKRGGF